MKSIANLLCCGVALAWVYSATAATEGAPAKPTTQEVATPVAKQAPPLAARTHKVDPTLAEKRLKGRAARTEARRDIVEKDPANRNAPGQQGTTRKMPN